MYKKQKRTKTLFAEDETRIFTTDSNPNSQCVSAVCWSTMFVLCFTLFVCVCAGFYICTKFQLLNECNGILFVVLYSVSFSTVVFYFWLRATQNSDVDLVVAVSSHTRAFTPLLLITLMHTVCFARSGFDPFYKTSVGSFLLNTFFFFISMLFFLFQLARFCS